MSEQRAYRQVTLARVHQHSRAQAHDQVATEVPVALVYNCQSHAVMMASPCHLLDFAYGFTLSEGIVESASELLHTAVLPQSQGVTLAITIPEHRASRLHERSRSLEGRSGCGLCGIQEMAQALRPLPTLPETAGIPARAIAAALTALPAQQLLNRDTGALHAAAFADREGALRIVREDIGRHNALDKLIGATARAGINASSGVVLVTSRCSMEMVQKTIAFGCPLLVAVSAPTSLAIELAQAHNLTIAAFARNERFNLYSHPQRVL
ncbi:MAG: formate dehydrogenase accessory sulfurtransferase FdhD [Gammaproteobacteria bacterium]|nr:formate dehydrogenase accessory sulfurtransferase FdhD [Gammaproteobacteria bacterium]